MTDIECFKIRLLQFEKKLDIFDLEKGKTIYDINCLKPYFTLNPVIINADPFLFVHNERLFLFYEEKGLTSSGVIKMTSTNDLRKWTPPIVVLKESYHLSFPWVFEYEGDIYMLPETSSNRSIRLYKATNNQLKHFEYVQTLLSEPMDKMVKMSYADSCIFKNNNIYYLFTMIQYEDGINTLELYLSDSLKGHYRKHPMSPIISNSKYARNAGAILYDEGNVFRFSQDCTKRYGDNIHISEIIELTPTVYKERIIKENIIPINLKYYKQGGHQYNVVEFKGKWLVATDAKEYHKLLIPRLLNKLYHIL